MPNYQLRNDKPKGWEKTVRNVACVPTREEDRI